MSDRRLGRPYLEINQRSDTQNHPHQLSYACHTRRQELRSCLSPSPANSLDPRPDFAQPRYSTRAIRYLPLPSNRMADLLHGHSQEYFDSLEVPTLAEIRGIARKQEEKEREVEKKYHSDGPTEEQKAKAAGTIQVRNDHWDMLRQGL
jgi:hypothetical protein